MFKLRVFLVVVVGLGVAAGLIYFLWPQVPSSYSIEIWSPAGEKDPGLVENYVLGQTQKLYTLEQFKSKSFARVYWLLRPSLEMRGDYDLLYFGREPSGLSWFTVASVKRIFFSDWSNSFYDLKNARLVDRGRLVAETSLNLPTLSILVGGALFIGFGVGFFFWVFLSAKPKLRSPIHFGN